MSYGDKPMGYNQQMMNAALELCRVIESGPAPTDITFEFEEYISELTRCTIQFAQSMGGWGVDVTRLPPGIAAVYLTAVMVRAQSSVIGSLE